ncbi:DUF2059 domain-containing protein [Paracoccus sp. M683]|uniref:DUF2059 domain-containing protein n=1 Tax=Paracoccus sp. M683 TaxID=2594268 RepID=UPI00163DD043|nr:DUF2059 domain-containing protein [Paracoccus sp. M683]
MTLFTTGIAAAETREERLAVATEYNDAALADTDMDAMIRTMWEPLVAQFAPTATDDQKTQIHALYVETFEPRMTDLMKKQPEVMADIFTLDELQDLKDFYATPSGRAVMQKLPQVMQAIQPEIMVMVQETLPTIVPKVQEILAPAQ